METSASFEARSAPLSHPTANKRTYGSGAARIAAIPGGENPTDRSRPVTVVVISSREEGDRLVGSLEVKALVAGRNPGQIRPEGRAT